MLATLSLAQTLRQEGERRGFFFGAAINEKRLPEPNHPIYWDTFNQHFNMGVAENHCKPGYIQQAQGVFDFTDCTALLNRTKQNEQKFRGHALVWHNGNASWFDQGNWSPSELADLLQSHVSTVAGNYAGDVYAWDVVNEAIDWTGSGNDFGLRTTQWSNFDDGVHENYIHAAFDWASQADPNALLFYNDFRLEITEGKVAATIALIQSIQAAGIKIDGVGMQYHVGPQSEWNPGYQPHIPVSRQTTADVIRRFGELGIQVHITEIDVDLCDPSDTEPCVATPERLAAQAQMYEDAFNACYHDNPDVCTAFVSWGFTDNYTWKREDFKPLYFTADYETKPSYTAVLDAIKQDRDILPDFTAYARKANNLNNKPLCVGCEGNVGDCRWSWPLGDAARGNSDQADWRCERTYNYGNECSGNYEYCEDWCSTSEDGNACRWSWPSSDPARWNSTDAACRCDMRRQEFSYNPNASVQNNRWGLCDRCTGDDPVCRKSWPMGAQGNWQSPWSNQRCFPN